MRKLNATVDDLAMGHYCVTVTDVDTEQEFIVVLDAASDKEAAFKAMEKINDQ